MNKKLGKRNLEKKGMWYLSIFWQNIPRPPRKKEKNLIATHNPHENIMNETRPSTGPFYPNPNRILSFLSNWVRRQPSSFDASLRRSLHGITKKEHCRLGDEEGKKKRKRATTMMMMMMAHRVSSVWMWVGGLDQSFVWFTLILRPKTKQKS